MNNIPLFDQLAEQGRERAQTDEAARVVQEQEAQEFRDQIRALEERAIEADALVTRCEAENNQFREAAADEKADLARRHAEELQKQEERLQGLIQQLKEESAAKEIAEAARVEAEEAQVQVESALANIRRDHLTTCSTLEAMTRELAQEKDAHARAKESNIRATESVKANAAAATEAESKLKAATKAKQEMHMVAETQRESLAQSRLAVQQLEGQLATTKFDLEKMREEICSVEQECHKTREELAQARKELQVQSSEAEQAETVLRQQKDEMEEWAADRYVCTNAHPQCAHVS